MRLSGISIDGTVGFHAVPGFLASSASNDIVIGLYVRLRDLVLELNRSQVIPITFKKAEHLQGTVPFSISAYARRQRVSHTTVNRWIQELEQLGLITTLRVRGKAPMIRVKPWGEHPEIGALRLAHQFRSSAEQTHGINSETNRMPISARSSDFKAMFNFINGQDTETKGKFIRNARRGVQVGVQEEFKKDYKKNLRSETTTLRENSLPAGSLASGGAFAPGNPGTRPLIAAAPSISAALNPLNWSNVVRSGESALTGAGEAGKGGSIPIDDPYFDSIEYKNRFSTFLKPFKGLSKKIEVAHE